MTESAVTSNGDGACLEHDGGGRLAVVTGAAGFIGSTLSEALVERGWHVRGVDAFTSNYDPLHKRANVAALVEHPAFDLVEADLATADLEPLVGGADVVAHLAAEPGVSTSWGGQFERYVERNVLATQRLLDALSSTDLKRFVYASSSSVYGPIGADAVEETALPRPASPYGVTKLAAENLVQAYAAQGLPAVALRYFSVFGPRQRPDMALHRLVEAALAGDRFTVFGDGSQARDFTYVDDVVSATVAALVVDLTPGTVLNVAGGQPTRVAELLALVGRLLDVELSSANEPERPGDVARTSGSVSAAHRQLRWTPHTELTVGVRKQIEWHVARRCGGLHRSRSGEARWASRSPGDSRLLIYTQDGLGLGHLRRASLVAAEFLSGSTRGTVLTISDSPLGTLLRDNPNHDYLKLPSIVKEGPGDWHPLALPLSFPEVQDLRAQLILETATAFRPDVMLVDHMPHGAMGELVPTLDALAESPTRVVLGMRDIIDAPEVVQKRWQEEGAIDALTRYYDRVMVYGAREVFDVAERYQWPPALADMVRYCGYACTSDMPVRHKHIRNRRLAGRPGNKLIVAMAGGGADGYPMMSTLLDALALFGAKCPSSVVLVTGPFMPDSQRQDLRTRAEGLPVRVRTTVREPLGYMAAADLVVAMAGYNTTIELLRVGTPAVLVPRRGPSREQRMRARRFAQRGWVTQLDPDDLSARRLADEVLGILVSGPPKPTAPRPDLGGIERAVEYLHAAALIAHLKRQSDPVPGVVHEEEMSPA